MKVYIAAFLAAALVFAVGCITGGMFEKTAQNAPIVPRAPPSAFLGAAVAYPIVGGDRSLYLYHYAIDGKAYAIELWDADAVERFGEYLRSLGYALYPD
jgi:hypothetical protein